MEVRAGIGAAWTYWKPGVVKVSPGAAAALGVVVLLATLSRRSGNRTVRSYAPVALAVLVAAEAKLLAPHLIAQGWVADLHMPTPTVRFLSTLPGHFRVYSPRGLVSLAQAVAHGLETADGNDPFQFEHYVRWASAASGCDLAAYSVSVPACAGNELDPQAYLRAQPDGPLLGVGNVRYVVTAEELPIWSMPLIWRSGAVRIYENPSALPRVFVVPAVAVEPDDTAALDLLTSRGPMALATVSCSLGEGFSSAAPFRSVEIIRWTANHIKVQADGPGWLVVSQAWAPAWVASVDGEPTEVYRTDVAFCGLPLGEGAHSVELTYRPTLWAWGRFVSLATVAILAASVIVGLWRIHQGVTSGNAGAGHSQADGSALSAPGSPV